MVDVELDRDPHDIAINNHTKVQTIKYRKCRRSSYSFNQAGVTKYTCPMKL